jgi:hypothetical protein
MSFVIFIDETHEQEASCTANESVGLTPPERAGNDPVSPLALPEMEA